MPFYRFELNREILRIIVMAKSSRNAFLLVLPLVVAGIWLASGSGVFSRPAENEKQLGSEPAQSQNNLQQAATSIVAAAKERIATAKTKDEALYRAHLSDEALRTISSLGEFDASKQFNELLETYRTSSYPGIVDPAIQLRLAGTLRDWEESGDAVHAAAFERYVADVKNTGLTRGQAGMLYRASNMLGDGRDRKLAAKAIEQLLPLARSSKDKQINEMATIYEGTLRRLELVGKPLEIEGKFLDGSKLDWNSYRGKVVLIDCFVNSCIKCRQEVPNVLENYQAYHDKGFEVIGVNFDNNPRLAKLYMEQTGFHFPTLFSDDPKASGWESPIARKYGITQTPRAILVNQEGKVVLTSAIGEQLVGALEDLLGPADHAPNRNGRAESTVTPAGELPTGASAVVPASAQEDVAPAPPADAAAPAPPKE
jgi:thiol-disulfide isomerase/thioredoxin